MSNKLGTWDEVAKSSFPVPVGELEHETVLYQLFPPHHPRATRPKLLGAVAIENVRSILATPLCVGARFETVRHVPTPGVIYTPDQDFSQVYWTPKGKLVNNHGLPEPKGVKPWPFVLVPRQALAQINCVRDPICWTCDSGKWHDATIVRRYEWVTKTELPLSRDQFF